MTLLSGAQANGPGQTLNCVGRKKALMLVSGTFDAEVAFEATLDGTNYFSYGGYLGANDLEVARVKAPGYVRFNVEAVAGIRPVVAQYRSGAVTVVGYSDDREGAEYSCGHFADATTGTLVKSGAGVLHSVVIGDAGTDVVVTVYDGEDATGSVIGVFKAAGSYVLDVAFGTGLYVVISATAMGDVVLSYR